MKVTDFFEEKIKLLNKASEIYIKLYKLEQEPTNNAMKDIHLLNTYRSQLRGICMAAQALLKIPQQEYAKQIIENAGIEVNTNVEF